MFEHFTLLCSQHAHLRTKYSFARVTDQQKAAQLAAEKRKRPSGPQADTGSGGKRLKSDLSTNTGIYAQEEGLQALASMLNHVGTASMFNPLFASPPTNAPRVSVDLTGGEDEPEVEEVAPWGPQLAQTRNMRGYLVSRYPPCCPNAGTLLCEHNSDATVPTAEEMRAILAPVVPTRPVQNVSPEDGLGMEIQLSSEGAVVPIYFTTCCGKVVTVPDLPPGVTRPAGSWCDCE